MVRFFCDEMGLFLKEGESIPRERVKDKKGAQWQPRFQSRKFLLADAQRDPRYSSLVEVLKAANRAVAHVGPADVDHEFKTKADHERLFDAIDWVEDLIATNIYEPNGRALAEAMRRPENEM